jgi:hypothetical protein
MFSFSEACLIVGLFKDEGGGKKITSTTKSVIKDVYKFVLTKEKLKVSFEREATSYHPENQTSYRLHMPNLSQEKKQERAFRKILTANRYLCKCLQYGLDTYQKSISYEEQYPGFFWDISIDDDQDFVIDMKSFVSKLKSIGLEKNDDIKSFITFCDQTRPAAAAATAAAAAAGNFDKEGDIEEGDIEDDNARDTVEATKEVIKIDGIKYWKNYDTQLLRFIAYESTLTALSNSNSNSNSNSIIQSMDKDNLIFACMKPYAPLINKYCIIKGLSSSTPSISIWNNRKVFTVDYKKGMFIKTKI